MTWQVRLSIYIQIQNCYEKKSKNPTKRAFPCEADVSSHPFTTINNSFNNNTYITNVSFSSLWKTFPTALGRSQIWLPLKFNILYFGQCVNDARN